jgi:uncharacterized protein with von Willebrand factor type A (vWA) domain
VNSEKPKSNSSEPAPLAKWTEQEREIWLDLLESYSSALLPADEDATTPEAKREYRAESAVILGARLADIAIEQYQLRLYAQTDGAEIAASDDGIEAFQKWLERRHARRARRKSRSTR